MLAAIEAVAQADAPRLARRPDPHRAAQAPAGHVGHARCLLHADRFGAFAGRCAERHIVTVVARWQGALVAPDNRERQYS